MLKLWWSKGWWNTGGMLWNSIETEKWDLQKRSGDIKMCWMWYVCCKQTSVLAMLALRLTKIARGHIMIKLKTVLLHGSSTNVGIVANSTHQNGWLEEKEFHASKCNFSHLYNTSKRHKLSVSDEGIVSIIIIDFLTMPARMKGGDMDINYDKWLTTIVFKGNKERGNNTRRTFE